MKRNLEEMPLLFDVVVVEGQEISYTARSGGNPRSILFLATTAGGWLSQASDLATGKVLFPTPQKWKGTVPKRIHQSRIYKKLGIPSEVVGKDKNAYARPVSTPDVLGANELNKADWKHVGDAAGLALWGLEQ